LPVVELDHESAADRGRFVRLERNVLGKRRLAVSDTDSAISARLSGKASCLSSATCKRQLFVATRGGEDVARCAALINEPWQRRLGRWEDGMVGYFAAAEGAADEVAQMLQAAEQWLKRHNMRKAIAGCNGNALLGMGILTDSFLESPMFPLPWNPRYYMRYLDAAGYMGVYPWWIYEIDFGKAAYKRWKERALQSEGCEVRPAQGRWSTQVEKLRHLFNKGFDREWEMQDFTRGEFDEAYGWLGPVIDRKMLQFVHVEGRRDPVGFAFGFPDWTPLFRDWAGKDPDMAALKKFRFTRAGVLAGAFLPEYRLKDYGAKAGATLFDHFEKLGLPGALYYPVNHVNMASRGLAETMGGTGRMLYHCYDKQL
jgi:hypothetical protein